METALGRPVTFTGLVVLVVTSFVIHLVTGSSPCHQRQTADGVLRFEETSNYEFAIETLFKELSCYAENFCTIKWMKDGQPIDKLLEQSLLHRGQVLRFTNVEQKDGGVYTCIASGNGKSIQKDIHFTVIEDCNEDYSPINIEHQGCVNATADIGNNVTFQCEYFVGDYKWQPTENWLKFNSTGTNFSLDIQDNWLYLWSSPEPLDKYGIVYTTSTYFTKMKDQDESSSCKCGCNPVFGVKLELWNISDFAYGTYALCVNSDTGNGCNLLTLSPAVPTPGHKVSVEDVHHTITIPMVVLILVFPVAAVLWRRFGTDIKLLYKDRRTVTSGEIEKTYDVYLSYDWYSDADRMFAMKLVHYMEEKGYKVFWEINCLPGGDTDDDIVRALETSWRSVIIFSPDYLASHRNFDVVFSMDQAKHYKKEIIPIIYRDISNVTEEHQSTLVKHVLSSRCLRFDQITTHPLSAVKKIVQKVWGDPQSEQSLHKELLLRLPPRHRTCRLPSTSSTSSEENFITTEIQPYVSSRMSLTKYSEGQRQVYGDQSHLTPVAFEPGQTTQRLYPSISEYGVHINMEVNI